MNITQNNSFPFYRPWSENLMRQSLADSWHGNFYMVDMQLGSNCNARCRHCDSACAELHQPAELDIDAVVRLIKEMITHRNQHFPHRATEPIQCYVCGLGEPTEPAENLPKLKELLRKTESLNVNVAMFSNGVHWDDELNNCLGGGGHLSVQIQSPSNNPAEVARSMGISKSAAIGQLAHRDQLYDFAFDRLSEDNGTNVCASLIPMKDTMPEIKNHIHRAIMHGVYPLIGELEEAGFCVGKVYANQKVSESELLALKSWMLEYYGWDYTVPICPAVFGAVHINYRNQVTVDWRTGMSCSRPNMVDPDPHSLCDFRDVSFQEISSLILEYRLLHIDEAKKLAERQTSTVFGGCGGQVQRVFKAYLDSYHEFQAEQ